MVYLSNLIGTMIIEAYANISHVFVRARGFLYLENGSPSSPQATQPPHGAWVVGRSRGWREGALHLIAITHSYL